MAILIFDPKSILIPINAIKVLPTNEIPINASEAKKGLMKVANRVIPPSKIKTGIAAKEQPIPYDAAKSKTTMKSITDLVNKIDGS